MLVRLLMALVGDAIFGIVKARHRGFQAEMERCPEQGAFIRVRKAPSPLAR